jgi:hypothetical protein
MEKGTTFVGLDVHKEAINVAMLLPGESSAVEWQTSNDPAAVRRLVRKVQRSAVGELRLCYEAGPCGYAVQRTLRAMGVSCIVVAPSLVPRRPGERVKTDRRDARKLAQLLRAGLLSEVHPPTEEDEAVRDLCRAREDVHADLVRGRHRVSKLLLRHGWTWSTGKKTWGQGHRHPHRHVPRCGTALLHALRLRPRPHGLPRPRPLRALLGRKRAPRGDHPSRQLPRAPPPHRGRLALPPLPQHLQPEEATPGTAPTHHRHRRPGHAPPPSPLQPHARKRQASAQGRRRRRT